MHGSYSPLPDRQHIICGPNSRFLAGIGSSNNVDEILYFISSIFTEVATCLYDAPRRPQPRMSLFPSVMARYTNCILSTITEALWEASGFFFHSKPLPAIDFFVEVESSKAFTILTDLRGKRVVSEDLVHHALGSLLSIHQAALILAQLLRVGLVSVQRKKDDDHEVVVNWSEACESAARCAGSSTAVNDGLVWQWCTKLRCGSEIQSMALDAAFLHFTPPTLSDPSGLDGRPDGFLLPLSALTTGETDKPYIPAPAAEIQKKRRPKYLETAQSAGLMANQDFAAWLATLQEVRGLHTSWNCWPSIGAPAACKISDLSAAKAQLAVFMHIQRCTQSWRRFVLGIAATSNTFAS
ncbi:hypothetical protein B0H11DRAFT_2287749 [Mycena galericulata]|nr:hypothetical protein B0H11DRAFT_2287749 [Mycena galericulata]